MIRRPPRSTLDRSSAASDVYKRQVALSLWNLKQHMVGRVFHPEIVTDPRFRLEVGVALVLLYCSFFFYRYAHRRNSLAFTLLAMALALWSVLMLFGQFSMS